MEQQRGQRRVKRNRREHEPKLIRVAADGTESAEGTIVHFIPAPFRFCLCCGVAYGARQKSDFATLASLSSEGRSTATTILSLSAIRSLKSEPALHERARKLLSFTDNRQDASLQAGHFNFAATDSMSLSCHFRLIPIYQPTEFPSDRAEVRCTAIWNARRKRRGWS